MNYFEVLELQEEFNVDMKKLEESYFQKQREFHPDKFVSNDDAATNVAIQKSTALNNAYKTLKDRFKRAAYIVELKKELEPQAPQELLVEMMELREAYEEEPENIVEDVREEIENLFTGFAVSEKKNDYKKMTEIFVKIKYLQRFMTEVKA